MAGNVNEFENVALVWVIPICQLWWSWPGKGEWQRTDEQILCDLWLCFSLAGN